MTTSADPDALDEFFSIERKGLTVCAEPDGSWLNSWGGLFGGYLIGLAFHAISDSLPAGHGITIAHAQFLRTAKPSTISVEAAKLVSGRNVTTGRVDLIQSETLIASVAVTATQLDGPVARTERRDNAFASPVEHRKVSSVFARSVPFLETHLSAQLIDTSDAETAGSSPIRVSFQSEVLGMGQNLPIAALGMMSDLVGVHLFDAVAAKTESQRAVIALNLTLNLLRNPLGKSIDLVSTGADINGNHVVGSSRLLDEGGFVGRVTQQALVREYRK